MTVWGGVQANASKGFNDVNNGVIVKEPLTEITITSTSYIVGNSYAVDVRGRSNLNYKLNNADTITDGVFKILGTEKEFENVSDLVLADFTETVVAENIDFGATIEAQVVLSTPIANALITAVLVQVKSASDPWGFTAFIRAK